MWPHKIHSESIQSPIIALKPRSGEQHVGGGGGWTPSLCSWRLLVSADILFPHPPPFLLTLSQSGGRTAGYRKSPSSEPRAHTSPLTSQGDQPRTPTSCFSAWAKNIQQIYQAITSQSGGPADTSVWFLGIWLGKRARRVLGWDSCGNPVYVTRFSWEKNSINICLKKIPRYFVQINNTAWGQAESQEKALSCVSRAILL